MGILRREVWRLAAARVGQQSLSLGFLAPSVGTAPLPTPCGPGGPRRALSKSHAICQRLSIMVKRNLSGQEFLVVAFFWKKDKKEPTKK